MSLNSISGGSQVTYLYNGQDQGKPPLKESPQASSPDSTKDGVIVSISDEAKAALAASSSDSSAKSGGSLRDRLDGQYDAATASGTFISFDSSKGGEWLDLSSFTDDELAQIQLNSEGQFSHDEAILAGGGLSGRMAHSLHPYAAATQIGDRRGQAMGINALYSQMSDDVRAALKWTPAMMASNNEMLQGDSAGHGWLSLEPILSWLTEASAQGGIQFTR